MLFLFLSLFFFFFLSFFFLFFSTLVPLPCCCCISTSDFSPRFSGYSLPGTIHLECGPESSRARFDGDTPRLLGPRRLKILPTRKSVLVPFSLAGVRASVECFPQTTARGYRGIWYHVSPTFWGTMRRTHASQYLDPFSDF